MAVSTGARRAPAARRTSVGLKVVMAVTGILFLLFVLAHMYGNLKAFAGQEAFDGYSHHLRVLGEPVLPRNGFLWLMRVALIVSVVLHAWSAFTLWARANRARSSRYVKFRPVQATWSSRTMRWGGVAILLFVIFHILQFTTLTIEVGGSFASPYERLVAAFQVWYIVLVYALAMIALGMHLRHGIWSAVQTLGWSTRRREPALKATALGVAALIVVGFLAPPIAILIGVVN